MRDIPICLATWFCLIKDVLVREGDSELLIACSPIHHHRAYVGDMKHDGAVKRTKSGTALDILLTTRRCFVGSLPYADLCHFLKTS